MIEISGMTPLEEYLESTPLPQFCRALQRFPDTKLADIPAKVRAEFNKPETGGCIRAGQRIAICVGSRGIRNLKTIVKQTVDEVRSRDALPYIIPAMGSHGNATAEGQRRLLSEYEITERHVGAPVVSSMEVVEIARASDGTPVFADRTALDMDGIILVNRIKPHPSFGGPFESGLIKMAVIGLGKHRGAEACHRFGFGNFCNRLLEMGRLVLDRVNILFGVAILENAYDQTLDVVLVPGARMLADEPKLFTIAKAHMPKILLDELDVLVIDRIGKNISGSGADPNVTGKFLSEHKQAEFPPPKRIVMLDLTPETEGSAVGMGVADFVTGRLYDKLDTVKSYINGITSTLTSTCRLPMVMRNDYYALKAAIRTCNAAELASARIVRIRDTLSLDRIMVSEALVEEIRENPAMEQVSDLEPLRFDDAGDLVDSAYR